MIPGEIGGTLHCSAPGLVPEGARGHVEPGLCQLLRVPAGPQVAVCWLANPFLPFPNTQYELKIKINKKKSLAPQLSLKDKTDLGYLRQALAAPGARAVWVCCKMEPARSPTFQEMSHPTNLIFFPQTPLEL